MELYFGETLNSLNEAARCDAIEVALEREALIAQGYKWFNVIGFYRGERCDEQVLALTRAEAIAISYIDDVTDALTEDEIEAA